MIRTHQGKKLKINFDRKSMEKNTTNSLNYSLFEDSLGLDVDKGQGAGIVTTGEDEGAADNDKLQGILRVDNINFSESRSFKALLVAIQTLTPVLWNKSNLDLQLLKRIR